MSETLPCLLSLLQIFAEGPEQPASISGVRRLHIDTGRKLWKGATEGDFFVSQVFPPDGAIGKASSGGARGRNSATADSCWWLPALGGCFGGLSVAPSLGSPRNRASRIGGRWRRRLRRGQHRGFARSDSSQQREVLRTIVHLGVTSTARGLEAFSQ